MIRVFPQKPSLKFAPTVIATLLMVHGTTRAATITFDKNPFLGREDVLTQPGRQVVGNELEINFDIANDVYAFNITVFGIDTIQFANDVVGNLPTSGVNVVVLQTFDNDNDTGTPFGAGNAATLIANQIQTPGPGFFVYFNSGLNLARLVYSTDLDSAEADLKILARMLNLSGQEGRDAFPSFTAANFQISVPESGNTFALLSMSVGGLLAAAHRNLRRTNA